MFLEKLYTYCIYLERSVKVAGTEIPVESGRTGFKIGWQGFPMRRKAPTVKLYISEHFSAKCVTRRRCSCHRQFKFILLSLVTTQCTTLLIRINKQITYSTTIYGSPDDPRVGCPLFRDIRIQQRFTGV
jgi:hypothetical protein